MHVTKRCMHGRLDVLSMLEVIIAILTCHMMEAFNNKGFWVISGLKNVISSYVAFYFAEEFLQRIVVRAVGW